MTTSTPVAGSFSPIRVVLADDHPIVRAGMRLALERHGRIAVVEEAADGRAALAAVRRHQPDVLVLDISMPELSGFQVLEALHGDAVRHGAPLPHTLVVSGHCEREYVSAMLAAGAKGYLLKDEYPERIARGVVQIMDGEPVLSKGVQQLLISQFAQPSLIDLTAREREVICLVARGFSDDEIAGVLGIKLTTTRNHIAALYRKLPAVRTRAEAVAWAWRNQLVARQM